MHDNDENEHQEHLREEEAMHQEHVHEEQALHKTHERIVEELERSEEELHREHVEEEETLHKQQEREEGCERTHLVKVTVDETTVEVERGTYTVATIKGFGSVPEGYNLLQEIDGKLDLLADDASVTIKGCEVFISRVKRSASS